MTSRGAAAASTSAGATAAGEAQRDAWLGCITWWYWRGDEFGEVSTYPTSSQPRSEPQSPGAAGATAEAWGMDDVWFS